MTPRTPARRATSAVGAVMLLAVASGCAAAGAESTSTLRPPHLIKAGVLTACSDMPYAPFEWKKNGRAAGFDIDLVRKVAENLHLKLVVKDTDFEAIQSGDALNSDQCDVAISAMTITGERAQVLDFSSPYFNASQALVVPKGTGYKSLADLAGKKIGVQGGTTGELYVTDHAPTSAHVVPLTDANAMQAAMDSHAVDAVVYDNTVVGDVVANDPSLQVSAQFDTGEQYGMAVKKNGNVDLLRSIDKLLAKLKSDGGYGKIYAKWFGGTKH